MNTVKFVAEGFVLDANKLLTDFANENTVEFSSFSRIFKEMQFSFIYAGKVNEELVQFTQEIYQLTLGYLQSTSFPFQVGSVFMLYALYRCQLTEPLVRIRLTQYNTQKVTFLQEIATKNKYKALHYVINYLFKNAVDFVAAGNLFGPLSGKGRVAVRKKATNQDLHSLKTISDYLMDVRKNHVLEDTLELNNDYEEARRKVVPGAKSSRGNLIELISELDGVIKKSGKSPMILRERKICCLTSDIDIGSRRSKLKRASFMKKTSYWQTSNLDVEDDKSPSEEETKIVPSAPRKRVRKRRVPAYKRKVGRPKKSDLLEEILREESRRAAKEKKPKRKKKTAKITYTQEYNTVLPVIKNKEKIRDLTSSSDDEEEVKIVSVDEKGNDAQEEVNEEKWEVKSESSGVDDLVF